MKQPLAALALAVLLVAQTLLGATGSILLCLHEERDAGDAASPTDESCCQALRHDEDCCPYSPENPTQGWHECTDIEIKGIELDLYCNAKGTQPAPPNACEPAPLPISPPSLHVPERPPALAATIPASPYAHAVARATVRLL